MATDGPDPTPCDADVFAHGEPICMTYGISSNRMESWVRQVAEKSGQRVDWYSVGKRAVVKAIGDIDKVAASARELIPEAQRLYDESRGGEGRTVDFMFYV
jgi:hypothetical protein